MVVCIDAGKVPTRANELAERGQQVWHIPGRRREGRTGPLATDSPSRPHRRFRAPQAGRSAETQPRCYQQ